MHVQRRDTGSRPGQPIDAIAGIGCSPPVRRQRIGEKVRAAHAASPSQGNSKSVTESPVRSLIFFASSGLGRRSPLMMRLIVDGITPSSCARWEGRFPARAR